MTKRFRVETIEEELYPMPIYYDGNKKLGYVEIIVLLNKLHEENQTLKKELSWWKYRCGEDIGENDKMTKRFMVDDCGTLIDMTNRNTYDYVSDVCELLNELHEENTMLKESIQRFIHENDILRTELGVDL